MRLYYLSHFDGFQPTDEEFAQIRSIFVEVGIDPGRYRAFGATTDRRDKSHLSVATTSGTTSKPGPRVRPLLALTENGSMYCEMQRLLPRLVELRLISQPTSRFSSRLM